MSKDINERLDELDAEDLVINYYDETGPVQLTVEDQQRIRSYAKENGIFEVTVNRIGDYISFIATKWSPSGIYEKWCESRRTTTRDTKHITSVGQDNSEGGES